MNPWGLFMIFIGFILIVIGVKGTQGSVLSAFKGVKQGQTNISGSVFSTGTPQGNPEAPGPAAPTAPTNNNPVYAV